MTSCPKRVVWFVEHVARELDLACLAKAALEKTGIVVEIRQFYRDLDSTLREPEPEIVVLPFFYRSADQGIHELVTRWKRAVFFTLSFEQLLSPASAKTRVPGDPYARESVFHLAWGEFFKDFLTMGGVNPTHILVTGNPVYGLYQPPYSAFYPTRAELARKYSLDVGTKWLLFPEDQKYAFFSDEHIRNLETLGADASELESLRDYSRRCLAELISWSSRAAANGTTVIIRPRPATKTSHLFAFAKQKVPDLHPAMHFIKEESARDWILACDGLLSAYSTTLIEASVAEKDIIGAEIFDAPTSYAADWHHLVPKVRTREEFEARVKSLGDRNDSSRALRDWATQKMLPRGDAIQGILAQIRAWLDSPPSVPKAKIAARPLNLRELVNRFRGHRRLFSGNFHELDDFSELEVSNRVARWSKVLKEMEAQ